MKFTVIFPPNAPWFPPPPPSPPDLTADLYVISHGLQAGTARHGTGFPMCGMGIAAATATITIINSTRTASGVALVTGASRGIGAATALLLARNGWAVAVNYVRDDAAATAVADDITASGGTALVVRADVTDSASVGQMTCRIEERLGTIDTLVCNAAGVSDPAFGHLLDISPEAVEALVLAQLRALLTPARAVLPGMAARGRGSVVVVSSELARHPKAGFCALSVAKGTVEAAARAMAEEFGPRGVRVNTVAPGPTLTDAAAWASADVRQGWADLTPLHRNALADDVAGPIAFLAGDAARFVTGAHLPADGGVVMP